MSIAETLYNLLKQTVLEVPKARYTREEMVKIVGANYSETSDSWLVPCVQLAYPSATDEEISHTEGKLNLKLPIDLRRFLSLSNGGKFYQIPLVWLQDTFPGAQHVRYHIFSTSEIVEINACLFHQFRQILGDDPDFRDYYRLNYVAFCDAHNGNYLAILLDEPERGKVFFLHHGYFYRPYSELDADLYYYVAGSLERWLEIVLETGGWKGFPVEDVPGL